MGSFVICLCCCCCVAISAGGDANSFFSDLAAGPSSSAMRARPRVVDSDTVSVLSQDDTASLASFSYLA